MHTSGWHQHNCHLATGCCNIVCGSTRPAPLLCCPLSVAYVWFAVLFCNKLKTDTFIVLFTDFHWLYLLKHLLLWSLDKSKYVFSNILTPNYKLHVMTNWQITNKIWLNINKQNNAVFLQLLDGNIQLLLIMQFIFCTLLNPLPSNRTTYTL